MAKESETVATIDEALEKTRLLNIRNVIQVFK